jgi:CheY-like chemotaxis protein
MRALIVDDDDTVRTMMARCLSSAGYDTTEAIDGVVAWELLTTMIAEDHLPDVLVVDQHMPGLSGPGLARRVRSMTAASHLPIVLVSGAGLDGHDTLTELWPSLFLGKPFTCRELLHALQTLAGGS